VVLFSFREMIKIGHELYRYYREFNKDQLKYLWQNMTKESIFVPYIQVDLIAEKSLAGEELSYTAYSVPNPIRHKKNK